MCLCLSFFRYNMSLEKSELSFGLKNWNECLFSTKKKKRKSNRMYDKTTKWLFPFLQYCKTSILFFQRQIGKHLYFFHRLPRPLMRSRSDGTHHHRLCLSFISIVVFPLFVIARKYEVFSWQSSAVLSFVVLNLTILCFFGTFGCFFQIFFLH